MARPDWNTYFMEAAKLSSTMSTCLRRQVGAVIVLEKRILSTGFNGAPSKVRHCTDDSVCIRKSMNIKSGERHELCRGAHAESNAIVQAAQFGIPIAGSTLYCTHFPCSFCTKMIINAQIKNIFYHYSYPDEMSVSLIDDAGIAINKI
jgi:dCMP deaminase